MTSPSKLHLWSPGLQPNSGGIDAYANFFLRALEEIYPETSKNVFAKHDRFAPPGFDPTTTTRFHSTGAIPAALRTPAFAASALLSAAVERPDLVITTHPNFTRALRHLKRGRDLPYVSSMHGIEVWNLDSPPLLKGLSQAARLLSVSQYTKDRVVSETGIDPSKIGVVPDTFDHERFQIAPKPEALLQKYGLTPTQPVILTVGRLSKSEQYKGHDVLIDALPAVKQQLPDVHYIIAGRGDDAARLEARVCAAGLKESVTFAGFVPDDDLCDHYNLCDVFAMPSTGEGFGIVFLEALGCGKPVIAGNVDASVEAVDHGNLGALPGRDPALEGH